MGEKGSKYVIFVLFMHFMHIHAHGHAHEIFGRMANTSVYSAQLYNCVSLFKNKIAVLSAHTPYKCICVYTVYS